MILTKKISVKLNPSNMKWLNQFGIVGKKGEFVEIDISMLSKGSKSKIMVMCDNCHSIQSVTYLNYNRQTNNGSSEYYCNNCKSIKSKKTNLEKWGVDNPMKSEEILNKIRTTNLWKYGVENVFQLERVKNKIKKTNLEKYGEEFYTKTKEYIEKSRLTKYKRYKNPTYTNPEKAKTTNLERYGVETVLILDHVRSSMEIFRKKNLSKILKKTKNTNLEKYGVECVFESDLIKEKIKKTNLEKYGQEYILKIDSIKDKIKKTNLEKYGVDNPSKSKIVIDKKLKKLDLDFKNRYNLIDVSGKIIKSHCKDCGNNFEIDKSLFFSRKRLSINFCTICLPINTRFKSGKENEVYNFVRTIENSTVQSRRDLIKGEIDIYIPEKKLGIEFNGVYWHSEIFKDRMYHYDKSIQSRMSNIDLFHIWEDDWIYKTDIIKSMILHKIHQTPYKIYARKCEIREIVDNELIRNFLNKNHIQGFVGSSVKIGLFYKDELISLMTFGQLRKSLGQKHQSGKFEMVRFCNKLMTNVVGGPSKLIKYFIQNYRPTEIISYSDSSRSNGRLYEKIGFNLEGETDPNYYWVVDNIRRHRFNFRKDKLINQGFDPEKTEIEIMNSRGYYRIWDCGSKKWKLTPKYN